MHLAENSIRQFTKFSDFLISLKFEFCKITLKKTNSLPEVHSVLEYFTNYLAKFQRNFCKFLSGILSFRDSQISSNKFPV